MSEDDYDHLREKNIAERNAVFAEFFKNLKTQTEEFSELKSKYSDTENVENEPPKKRRRTVSSAIGDSNFKVKSVRLEFQKKYNTRSASKNRSKDNMDESKRNKPKLQILFPWAKSSQRFVDLMKMGVCDVDEETEQDSKNNDNDDSDEDHDEYDVDDDDVYTRRRKRYSVTKAPYDPNTIPSVDEITEHMLANIAEKSTNKQYCRIRGTSCHQCRQKTLDTKTVCRSGECIGVRGQFCGPCLRGRYGESALEALKDPKWACPACRGLCNCSICRTRSGLAPTGILAPVAQEEGYTSVMDYLRSNKNQ
ncbi:uncharacterized protein LOC143216458 [Lasioglossum baleicum]|uniref:uncharacterized protein LOC143216458 n=1 Tax=Lasioglossum baleicum TaxID=434251 RepID=UPI003FCD7CBF